MFSVNPLPGVLDIASFPVLLSKVNSIFPSVSELLHGPVKGVFKNF